MPSFSKLLAVGSVVALFAPTTAVKLDQVTWTPCSGGYLCGDLYFCCLPNNLYGYKASPSAPCVPGAGPTIRSVPGSNYNLTIHNTCEVGTIDPTMGMSMNSTNLHVHGTHTSGEGSHDNVFRMVSPGMCLWQIYDFLPDHTPGTYWYHPHLHKLVLPQAGGGAFGQWIVDGLPGTAKKGFDANVAKFLTNQVIERQLLATSTGLGNGDPHGATLQLTQNQWHYLRILHVIPTGSGSQPASFTKLARKSCQVYQLATDGVFFSKIPYQKLGSPIYSFQMHAASRLDLAVKCGTTGTFAAYTYAGNTVATFKVSAGRPGPENPFVNGKDQWQSSRPNYLADLRDGYYPKAVTTVAPVYPIILGDDMTINGMSWDPYVPTAAFPFGNAYIQQFNVTNSEDHPYHIHQQHFQVVQKGGCGPVHYEGEWYDSITSANDCLVRLRMVDFSGKIIHHCHDLDHEDSGMMGWFDVPFAAPGSFEASSLFVPLEPQYQCPAVPATAKGATVAGGTDPTGSSTAATAQCEAAPIYPWILMGVSMAVAATAVVVAVFVVRRSSHMKMAMFEEMENTRNNAAPVFQSPMPQLSHIESPVRSIV